VIERQGPPLEQVLASGSSMGFSDPVPVRGLASRRTASPEKMISSEVKLHFDISSPPLWAFSTYLEKLSRKKTEEEELYDKTNCAPHTLLR